MPQSFPPNHRPSYYPAGAKAENDNRKGVGDPVKWQRVVGVGAAAIGSAAIAAALIYTNRRLTESFGRSKAKRPNETD